MVRLVDRQKQIPNGMRYLQAETGWVPTPFSSFDTIVRGLIQHRMGNPHLIQKLGWATDYNTVAAEVDRYNAMLCQQMGWGAYIVTDEGVASPPKSLSPGLSPRLRAAAAGVQLHADWRGSGHEVVPKDKSEARAVVCVACPKNKRASLMDFFTVKAANYIERQIEEKRQMKLETSLDEHLGVCEACLCPTVLKVHTPLALILKHLSPEFKKDLHPACWILHESN